MIMSVRAHAYARQWLSSDAPALPTVGVGNLTVGGSGKTPLTAWFAQHYAGRGLRPGIILRGYGGDEGDVHRSLVPSAVVVEDADRLAGAREAAARGAEILVLDDAYQRLDVQRDLNVAVVSAESSRAIRWTLPAGPWREGWDALVRADMVVVTRKRASPEEAQAVLARISACAPHAIQAAARLRLTGFRGLVSGDAVNPDRLRDAAILVTAGVWDPDSFAAQCRALGARIRLLPWRDHHPFGPADVRRLLGVRPKVDYVVVTEKDAVKLRRCWPPTAPEPLVACLGVEWDVGQGAVERALDVVSSSVHELYKTT